MLRGPQSYWISTVGVVPATYWEEINPISITPSKPWNTRQHPSWRESNAMGRLWSCLQHLGVQRQNKRGSLGGPPQVSTWICQLFGHQVLGLSEEGVLDGATTLWRNTGLSWYLVVTTWGHPTMRTVLEEAGCPKAGESTHNFCDNNHTIIAWANKRLNVNHSPSDSQYFVPCSHWPSLTIQAPSWRKKCHAADDASHLWSRDDANLLAYFNATYPQIKSWQMHQLSQLVLSKQTLLLCQKKMAAGAAITKRAKAKEAHWKIWIQLCTKPWVDPGLFHIRDPIPFP
jgi:hypothetical protein